MRLIGRIKEQEILQRVLEGEKPEFVAIYGRRRVGKTFLVREVCQNQFTFYTTGLANANTAAQLANFAFSMRMAFQKEFLPSPDWLHAFWLLRSELEKLGGKLVVFIDELPWLDTKKSDFLTGLESFWNGWGSGHPGLKLITCGSAASWMINSLIRNTGGLYNRVTCRLKIEPFTLYETELFLKAKQIELDRYQILNLYMVLGGIPHYLEQVQQGLSAAQVIEQVCFSSQGMLRDEYRFLFTSLFTNGSKHEEILRAIFQLGGAATRAELIKRLHLPSNGLLTNRLAELEESGFISSYQQATKNKNGQLFCISDYYTLFYLKFIEPALSQKQSGWLERLNDHAVMVWAGLSFEQIARDHTRQIKKALGISGVYTLITSWRIPGNEEHSGAQIDIVLDRKDRIINLIEVKYAQEPFEITKAYDLNLRNKVSVFKEYTKTTKAIHFVMLTTYGIKPNAYAKSFVQRDITMGDLFVEIQE